MFSTKERPNYISELSEATFDILIIGGGMTGAGIALDAASRGLKTALVEKEDFGWGTSSRSTKLIHGGLRYLKQLQFGIVREVGLERAIVFRNALHIVRPVKMLLPIVKNGSLGSLGTRIGLSIYDNLANVKKSERKRILTKQQVLQQEPLLNSEILKGGGEYVEYRTDDCRLVIENLKKAHDIGATIINYAQATGFRKKDDHHMVEVKDRVTGSRNSVQAKVVVNAAGPWVDEVRKKEQEQAERKLFLSKGVHIVVSQARLPIKQPIYFDVAADQRMIFAIPRDEVVYLGPTDTAFDQNIDQPLANLSDVQYILNATNAMFPDIDLTQSDIISSWTGLRPLIFQEGKSPSEMSRKDEVFIHDSGIITIAGGKLTGYRKMAEKIVDLTVKRLNDSFQVAKRFPSCFTDEIKVSGSDFKSEKELKAYRDQWTKEAKNIGLSADWFDYLVYTYGSNTDIIIGRYQSELDQDLTPHQRILKAELWYAVDHEMVHSLSDFFIRRTGRLYFNRGFTLENYAWIAECLQKELGWSDAQKEDDISSYLQEAESVLQFD